MADLGSFLLSNSFMNVGDYLSSPNKMFFAYMQADGNFCVYRGTPENNQGALWCSGKTSNSGEFFAAMTTDGNFCVYKGTPSNNQGALWCWTESPSGQGQYFLALQDDANLCVYKGTPGNNEGWAKWCTMKTDTATFTPNDIVYDLANAQELESTPTSIYTQDLSNQGSTVLMTTIRQTEKVQETEGWSNTLSVSVTAGTEIRSGIPLFADGKISLSTTIENAYTWNGSKTVEKSWGFDVQVQVPANTTMKVDILVMMTKIKVPYTVSGVFSFASKRQYKGSIAGSYVGTNSHGLKVEARNVTGSALSQAKPHIVRAVRT
ncbi:MAG TPA: ETX/MTX2 family pore-forming toxin [Myxococcaceae bacterium]|nr:ETX/MTX2 family pore-forming toxin [Myxococcaceae bacterium]